MESMASDEFPAPEIDAIVRAFFRAERIDGESLCSSCGGSIEVRLRYPALSEDRESLEIHCRECGRQGRWVQERPAEDWKDVHMSYFLECQSHGRAPLCPIDDSSVLYFEFSDGVFEFRCPYCNRRGRGSQPKLDPEENGTDLIALA